MKMTDNKTDFVKKCVPIGATNNFCRKNGVLGQFEFVLINSTEATSQSERLDGKPEYREVWRVGISATGIRDQREMFLFSWEEESNTLRQKAVTDRRAPLSYLEVETLLSCAKNDAKLINRGDRIQRNLIERLKLGSAAAFSYEMIEELFDLKLAANSLAETFDVLLREALRRQL